MSTSLCPVLGFFSLSTAVVNCYYQVEVAMFVGPRVLFCQQVFCCLPLVSLKLTQWGFINSSCQSGLCAWGLYNWFVCLTSVGGLHIKKKKRPGAVKKLTQCRKRSLIFQSQPPADFTKVLMYVCVWGGFVESEDCQTGIGLSFWWFGIFYFPMVSFWGKIAANIASKLFELINYSASQMWLQHPCCNSAFCFPSLSF